MKEVVNYPNFEPKGLIKIELFDALTGKKKEEIKTHNFISAGLKNHLMKLAMKSLFTKGRHTGGVDLYSAINDPFQCMYLTDASHPEQPDREWLIKGKNIGFAYTNGTYSGSDTLRGSYNANESFTRLDQVRIVVDFPTHAGNGTFQSIYFTYDGNKFTSTLESKYTRLLNEYVKSAKKYGDYIYILENSGIHLSVLTKDYELINRYTFNSLLIDDFEIYNNYIYYVNRSTTDSVLRATLSEPTNTTRIATGFYPGGICFDTSNKHFIIACSNNSSDKNVYIRKYDENFNLLSNKQTNFNSGTYDLQMNIDNGDIIVGNLILVGDDYLRFAGIHSVRGIIDNQIVTFNGYLIPKIGISSRTLLDSPVTKTSNNTMKITYDFILD